MIMTIKKLLTPILFLFCAMVLAADVLPFQLNTEWNCYSAKDLFQKVQPESFSVDATIIKNAEKKKITLDNGSIWLGRASCILVNEFHSDKDGIMILNCGTDNIRFKLAFNGKRIADIRTSFPDDRLGMKGSHDFALNVKKGKNTLVITSPGGKVIVGPGKEDTWSATFPSRKNFASISYAPAGTRQRTIEELLVRNGVDGMTATVLKKFRVAHNLQGKELEKVYNQYPVLEFYDRAFLKILKEVQETKVKSGIAVWLIYNMGYVVKTPETCFGIDVYHRLGAKLVPYLDFALISHAHSDHYDPPFYKAMIAAGKPVICNFLPESKAETKTCNPPANRTIKDVTLEFHASDHNAKLRNYIMCSRIICGRGKDAVVIYHTGDTGYAKQLKPSGKVDIHILHPRVGLSVPDAAALIKPGEIWFSHLLEMGHCFPSIWRPVEYAEGYRDAKFIRERGDKTGFRHPLWGEKFVILPQKESEIQ